MVNTDPLLLKPNNGGATSTSGILTANSVQVIGFTVAGLALIALSRFFPTFASFLAIAILLGVGLTHSTQITALITRFTDALGESNSNG